MFFWGKPIIENLKAIIEVKDKELSALRSELSIYHRRAEDKKRFEYFMNEKIPEEENARKAYFADITMFYEKIFKDKIAHMVSIQKNNLTVMDLPVAQYDIFRATINCFDMLDEWFSRGEREHLSNLNEKRQAVEDGIGIVDELSKKYKV